MPVIGVDTKVLLTRSPLANAEHWPQNKRRKSQNPAPIVCAGAEPRRPHTESRRKNFCDHLRKVSECLRKP